ncbi:transcription termination/antitermination protein NusA [Candidatus Peregrinibacteria bacterium CG22_combo_CG10-13_8_21_14_all_44_10]|nr:MAG: transcription termination factor NusA [Candidatus Peregrinibacteria bacterium CG2_30_44_17]PIP65895.1 MAG: transcription termination/antitermination protein NusA [Candidatus Peregrinibacteria bacterium CG22_combo_CG10-13_8_21_14_all_44_10]PIS03925.1 MAG: transcription termination/antitermination protein NusA [Candidatus Peregrinibacteria bacterium CG10_big_fil_rev_8_21_14_0_10_44_7]PIX80127.1 MAG: transcription termination/antitermination protein NusA [Candidatus Peregrinibacteria bacter
MQSQFLAAINQLADEKNIPREAVLDIVKAALKTAYKKDFGSREQNIDIDIDEKTELATIYLVKEVVAKVEDPELQMSLTDAKKIKGKAKVGDEIRIDVTPMEGYGRIAAQSAKQVIIQRIQEVERDLMYDTFKDRENELINALVHRVENNQVFVDLGKITTLLPYDQQIPGERYYGGQRIKIYLDKVVKTTKGPQLIISRTHSSLVRKLLELEIPEIKEEIVEIKGVARDPGVRCKIAVTSHDEKIDPIGACVGQKGVRVQNITNELHGERIDVIEWATDPAEYIKRALAPAEVSKIVLNEDQKRASVYVASDQRALAIGKQGQNVRLASILTEWELDILDVSDMPEEKAKVAKQKKEVMDIESLGVSKDAVSKLATANLTLVEQVKGLTAKDLQDVEGITEEESEEIVAALKKVK